MCDVMDTCTLLTWYWNKYIFLHVLEKMHLQYSTLARAAGNNK